MRGHTRTKIDKFLATDVTEPVASKPVSQVVFLLKKDGTLRFCLDH